MAKDRKIDMVILGLLSHEDLTGYDIKKRIDSHISFFWKGSFGSIYPALSGLQEQGMIVDTASNGQIAVDMIREKGVDAYDFILMDVQMPIMDGYETTRRIRASEDPRIATLPIVAMTANAFDEDRREALDAGMDAHVTKPIDVKVLVKTLSDVLFKEETQDE